MKIQQCAYHKKSNEANILNTCTWENCSHTIYMLVLKYIHYPKITINGTLFMSMV